MQLEHPEMGPLLGIYVYREKGHGMMGEETERKRRGYFQRERERERERERNLEHLPHISDKLKLPEKGSILGIYIWGEGALYDGQRN